ncbi:hypothetical protein [Caballeronia sp. dw_19]|uniref:hypothetical protein n=1 Tax=Caballeronia sp. dw_19 TaxID=2719791 RepID=UPI001BD63CAF|nr:hypothetical protein [Caballeronia sp. dw_19]
MLFFAIGVILFLYKLIGCCIAQRCGAAPKDSSPETAHSQERFGTPSWRFSRIVRNQGTGEIDYPILRHPKSQEEKHKQNPGHKTYCTAD